MRSFHQLLVLLFAALFAFAQAQEDTSYDATVYVTSTIYRVNTVTMSGSPPASVANVTSTISTNPSQPSNGTSLAHPTGGATPTTSGPTSEFTGAASHINANALLALLAAGVGYMAL